MTGRDQPRALAPVLFAGFNIICNGIPLMITGSGIAGYAKIPGSLFLWGIAFCLIGLTIACGLRWTSLAHYTSLVALGFWGMWATFMFEAHIANPRHVSWRAPLVAAGIAILHLVLRPYYRKPKPDPRCVGT